ncbi:MAG: dehydratase [Sneathiella sp.]|jgi:acyl dehydratase|uniref:MaoC family dehydratase n=1 Tax=Sneathiella sp. TaxID=1964365 RepID=UPI000C65F165|nr:MaoC family dehydratase [Sneathiella sp.]MAL77657.1 dehydratase [Sneathiella sp.]|tara:strand:- start:488 stop:973 length:486 start_codon:yes stop_codon:yes gene_type:complete
MSDSQFNPENHKFGEASYFEDLTVGQCFYIPSRTLRDANFAAFQLASGDNHPIHYDVEYCKAQGHPELLAHGFQVLIQSAPGAGLFPHVLGEAMVAFIDQSSKFLGPVYCGDTVYPELVITDLKEQRSTGVVTVKSTIHNQRRELVMEGEQRFLVRRRSAA